MEKARAGLQAWQDGDLSALEELLPDWPDEPATVIRFRDGKAIEMRQFKSRQEALTAAASQN
jgi:hypothetical protein